MPVITSISGIRGTIGGTIENSLTPINIVQFTAAFGDWVRNQKSEKTKIVVGRDARISGPILDGLVCSTLNALGIDVINIGLATTPTTEIAVIEEKADGGLILTASHNPKNWNALKLLNNKGEFLDKKSAEKIFLNAKNINNIQFAEVDDIGEIIFDNEYVFKHIDLIKNLELVDVEAIKASNFTVAVDCINSVGAIAVPELLKQLGVKNIVGINCVPNGNFAHNPEPVPENLVDISNAVLQHKADVGFVVDPDVDRLAIVQEDGKMFGEEYTLVSVADYILSDKRGNTVSNLSSSRALADITRSYGGEYFTAAVGELNVVEKMKAVDAIIGGEGNGGVIYPEIHYGRDALVGIALFLSYLAKQKIKVSDLRKRYPEYVIIKKKQNIEGLDVDKLLEKIQHEFKKYNLTTIDGVKIDFDNGWVHLRKSNTEPIIRIYAEAKTNAEAENLVKMITDKF
ncbi:MAG: phosphoglucosamine mutase [Bacteroidales bacterium]|nr:phosphoglucosamine mutase [Bacteroidales bacterium]